MISVKLNTLNIDLQEEISVEELLRHQNIAEKGIAVAINEEILFRDSWATTRLKDQDDILIIQATQGG